MHSMVSGRDRGLPGGCEITCSRPDVLGRGGLVRTGGGQQGVEPGDHECGVDSGRVVEGLVGHCCAPLRFSLVEEGGGEADLFAAVSELTESLA